MLKEAETQYLEALTVVEAIRAFDAHVYRRCFSVWTDHQPLSYVFTKKTKSARLNHFAYKLGDYDIIHYKQGVRNHVPDLLSRPAGDSTPSAEMFLVEELELQPGSEEPNQETQSQLQNPIF